jgi:two-component sensor histidine kinase
MESDIACLNIKNLYRMLKTETDESRRQLLARRGEEYCRSLALSLKNEKELSALTIKELAHRLRNRAATVQSIVAYQLREHVSERSTIMQRLGALSSTDALIDASSGEGTFIKDIVDAELLPYELSRSLVEGPRVFVSADQARALALVFHELATNAAKYGCLSTECGQVSLRWTMVHDRLRLEWRESGGPPVSSPVRRGFGTRLLSCALEPFAGVVDLDFAVTGLVCTITVRHQSIMSCEPARASSR